MTEQLLPIAGGVLIGVSASILLLFNGRIAGVSGIAGNLLAPVPRADWPWRFAYLGGLVAGGFFLHWTLPHAFGDASDAPQMAVVVIAGLLVGFGTRLANGCTSGHGVCGLARGSKRSLAATLTFMAAGALAVLVVRLAGGVA